MTEIDSKERITAVWSRQQPDRKPWSPMLGDSYMSSQTRYWNMLNHQQRRLIQSRYKYPSIVSLPVRLDFLAQFIEEMTIDVGGDYITNIQTINVFDNQVETEVLSRDDGTTMNVFHTPWGDLDEIVTGSDSAETVYHTKYAIPNRDQYKIMRKIVQDRVL